MLGLTAGLSAEWPRNLVLNPGANLSPGPWVFAGDARIEAAGAAAHFVVRRGGRIVQTLLLPPNSAGRFLVVTGRGAGERVNPDGAITDVPYLYAIVSQDDGRILLHAQGQQMRARYSAPNVWVRMYGIFEIPEGASRVSFHLGQGLRRGTPHDGSAARFDDVGIFVLPTRRYADAFVRVLDEDVPPRPGVDLTAITPVQEAAFDPARGVVLPELEGLVASVTCSRVSPGPVEGVWTPDVATIERLDAVLAPVLRAALDRSSRERVRAWSTAEYYRQYAGLTIRGSNIVYVNAFRSPSGEPPPKWQTEAMRTCDGAELAFGAELDPATGKVLRFHFNSPR